MVAATKMSDYNQHDDSKSDMDKYEEYEDCDENHLVVLGLATL